VLAALSPSQPSPRPQQGCRESDAVEGKIGHGQEREGNSAAEGLLRGEAVRYRVVRAFHRPVGIT